MLKQFGSAYLILGTCIAAGMLGLPIVTAQYHFTLTVILLVSSWLIMTTGAWCLLQVNMTMPARANFLSMSEATLGKTAKNITWFIYLMLLYSILCAYLSASGDVLQSLMQHIELNVPRWLATIMAAVILGSFVLRGIHTVDLTNRFLMSIKFVICFLLILSVAPFVHESKLSTGNWQLSASTWLVVITAFGYANILPSIRDYLNNDRKKIVRIFTISSSIPLILYFAWIIVIQGALSRHALIALNNSPNTNSLLISNIASLTHNTMLHSVSLLFISICSVTGFLSVSTSLIDVWADGLQNKRRVLIALLAFVPPIVVVIFDPSIFVHALAYAGMCCILMFVVLPVMMYSKKFG